MNFINYIKYLFGWTDYLLFIELAIRNDELNELFLEEMCSCDPDYKRCELLNERINKNYDALQKNINSKKRFGFKDQETTSIIPLSKIKPSDFKV